MVHTCLNGQAVAPQYLADFCRSLSAVTSRHRLRSARRQLLEVPRYALSSFARRAFTVAGPSAWNSLPEYLRDPAVVRNSFRKQLKTFLSSKSLEIKTQSLESPTSLLYSFRFTSAKNGRTTTFVGAFIVTEEISMIKLEFHDADTDTDILARILARMDRRVGRVGEDVRVGVGVSLMCAVLRQTGVRRADGPTDGQNTHACSHTPGLLARRRAVEIHLKGPNPSEKMSPMMCWT